MTYPKLIGFSKQLWLSSQPIIKSIEKTPLVTGFIRGLTPKENTRFTQQDIYYLEEIFQPVMLILSQKATASRYKKLFTDFIVATDVELQQLKSQLPSDKDAKPIKPSTVCKKYGKHLIESATNKPFAVGLVACLPCFLFFPAIGLHIKNIVTELSNLENHPQAGWIKVYAEELFDNAYIMASFVNEVIEEEDEEMAQQVYMTSAKFELDFFRDALAESKPEIELESELATGSSICSRL